MATSSARNDERLSESHRKLIGGLEDKVNRQSHTIRDLERTNYTTQQRLVQLVARFGFGTVEEAEAAAVTPTAVYADRISRLEEQLHARDAEVANLETKNTNLSEDVRQKQKMAQDAYAQWEFAYESVRKQGAERAEQESKRQALMRKNGLLREQELRLQADIRRLEAIVKLQEERIAALSAEQSPPLVVGKENITFPAVLSSTNSAPSTPSKRGSPSKHGSPFKHRSPSTTPKKSTVARLEADLRVLQTRYDALYRIHERTKARFQDKFQRWHGFKKWLDAESREERAAASGLDPDAREALRKEHLLRKVTRMTDVLRLLDGAGGDADDGTPAPTPRERPRTPTIPSVRAAELADRQVARAPPLPPHCPVSPPTTNPTSPEVRSAQRKRAHERPHHPSRSGSQETPRKRVKTETQASSDTEDDSQALPPTPLPRPSVLLETLSRAQPRGLLATPTAGPSRLPAVASSSAVVPAASVRGAIPRPDDIFAPEAVAPPPPSIPPSRPRRHPTPPLFAVPVPAVKREELPMPLDALMSPVASVQDVKPVMHTPVSLPRGPAKHAKEHFVQGSSRAPLPALGTMGPPTTASSGASNNTALATTAGGMPVSSSSRAAKTSGDYSAYKGRGRYGRARKDGAGDTTINSAYEVDPAQNAGHDFAFDEVVRNREERRRLPASDCEQCRAYYENVGPLPRRAQAPLWRSPSTSPAAARVRNFCTHHGSPLDQPDFTAGDAPVDDTAQQREIEQHRGGVSRHRARWARAETPPAYWAIAFPDTQQVEHINAEASGMHDRQLARVAAEADRAGGRYRKRGEDGALQG